MDMAMNEGQQFLQILIQILVTFMISVAYYMLRIITYKKGDSNEVLNI